MLALSQAPATYRPITRQTAPQVLLLSRRLMPSSRGRMCLSGRPIPTARIPPTNASNNVLCYLRCPTEIPRARSRFSRKITADLRRISKSSKWTTRVCRTSTTTSKTTSTIAATRQPPSEKGEWRWDGCKVLRVGDQPRPPASTKLCVSKDSRMEK